MRLEGPGKVFHEQSTWMERKDKSFVVYIPKKSCVEMNNLKLFYTFGLQLTEEDTCYVLVPI